MTDSINRLFLAVTAARDLDPATSRTARLFRSGHSKMVKKLAEEAIEAGIDAMNGDKDALVRESADLLYNLTVLWAALGVRPQDVWAEMSRRERMLGIAEKLPKPAKPSAKPAEKTVHKTLPKPLTKPATPLDLAPAAAIGRPLVALQSARTTKRR